MMSFVLLVPIRDLPLFHLIEIALFTVADFFLVGASIVLCASNAVAWRAAVLEKAPIKARAYAALTLGYALSAIAMSVTP